jgi:hypothetical protein
MTWTFDPEGPDYSGIKGPIPLVSKGLELRALPGLYLVTCGDCLAHVGTSKKLQNRVRQLATLGTHRGSAEVLCAAFCTKQEPLVRWEVHNTDKSAREREREFKVYYGEPPVPDRYGRTCKDGKTLRQELTKTAGEDTWEAGYIQAVFEIGEKLRLLFDKGEFTHIWKQVGKPPGPW